MLHLPVDGAPTLLLRSMDANGADRTATGIGVDDILGYPESLIHRVDAHPGEWVARTLAERGHGGPARVGYEGEAHFFTVRMFRALADTASRWTLEDCHDLVNWVRLVKSPAEIRLMRAAGRVCGAAMRAGIAALAPGRPQNEVAAAVAGVIEAAGYTKGSRLGYSIGIGYPPDWGERTVSIRTDDHTELAENMTFHLIAGMWMAGYGFEMSESIRVAGDGAELLIDVPRELITIDPERFL